MLYAFTTDEVVPTFPPPGLTTRWFGVAAGNRDIWDALWLSTGVAVAATVLALALGSLAAAAVARSRFFGLEVISFLVILPIALPGIVTGIALRSAITVMGLNFSTLTIVVGHTTFTIVIVYDNVLARLRRTSGSVVEASMDLGASAPDRGTTVTITLLVSGPPPSRSVDPAADPATAAGLEPLSAPPAAPASTRSTAPVTT